jgi:hypothetical protein
VANFRLARRFPSNLPSHRLPRALFGDRGAFRQIPQRRMGAAPNKKGGPKAAQAAPWGGDV